LPGTPARRRHDHIRCGTASLFAALEVASGTVIGQLSARHRSEEFRRFLNRIDGEVPAALEVHLILDNSSPHKTPRCAGGRFVIPASTSTSFPPPRRG
jgi:hypothetical protein